MRKEGEWSEVGKEWMGGKTKKMSENPYSFPLRESKYFRGKMVKP